jgi:D-glycero-alpha-D-manno-heptose-7-phosphate kinase
VNTIRAAAPIRICDVGGWTDTATARHGKVFNIAVRPLVSVRIDVFAPGTREAHVILNAENYGDRYAPVLDGASWGRHPLLEAALRAIRPPGDADLEITVRSKVPAGASTGTSAAVTVALLGALDRLRKGRCTIHEIAREAHAVETRWLGRQSGVQDQLCSAVGGVNFIEVTDYPHAVVTPLEADDHFRLELNRRLVLVYLGRSHSSSEVHQTVMGELQRLGAECAELQSLRHAAELARDAWIARDLVALGRAMRRNTDAQAALHSDLVHTDAWRIIEIAAAHGAIGWKVNGAGGDGGSMTLLASERRDERRAMVRAIGRENPACVLLPIAISRGGLRVW